MTPSIEAVWRLEASRLTKYQAKPRIGPTSPAPDFDPLLPFVDPKKQTVNVQPTGREPQASGPNGAAGYVAAW